MTLDEWLGEDNQLGQDIWHKKYQYNNETLDEWFDRVSSGDPTLKQYLQEKKLLLGGRAMTNRGTNNNAGYFNCYSYGYVGDSYKEIMQAAMDIGLTFKAQGGQGISLSKIRPKGTKVGEAYTSDGIIPFMKIFNEVTAGTSQGGARKGALMISLDARHKEAPDFIHIKSKEGLIEKANLSLEIDDEFMQAVKRFYETGERTIFHEKRNYSGHEIEYDVDPIGVFEALVDNCYDWGDPAVLYTNRFRNFNIMQYDDEYQIETCNPCGEQPLKKNGACCLASINLSEFVKDPYTNNAYFDFCDFFNAVKCGVETLDKIIDENYTRHPLKEQQEASYNFRNIGLGVFGYATMLMKLGLKYGEDDAIDFTDNLFYSMFRAAVFESSERAYELGSFPKYDPCVWNSNIIENHFSKEEIEQLRANGLRNCSLLSIAPTGSIASMCGESGGAEMEYAMKFTRRTVGMTDGEDTYYDVYCKAAREYMALHNTAKLPDYFVDAQHMDWRKRVDVQAAMQNHVDTAISSTVNLPNEATKDEIKQLYIYAWEKGLKGITIFRNGCKRMPILSTNNDKKGQELDESISHCDLPRGYILKTNDDCIGLKRKIISGCGSLHCTAWFDPWDGSLLEVFLDKGSTGGCERNLQALSRMISLAARGGIEIHAICDQLMSVGGCTSYCVRSATKHDTSKGTSCAGAVANALLDMWGEVHEEIYADEDEAATIYTDEKPVKTAAKAVDKSLWDGVHYCPDCGAELQHIGGCIQCSECPWSKCNG